MNRKARQMGGRKKLTDYKVLLPCLLGLNASVLPFRNKQEFSCKDGHSYILISMHESLKLEQRASVDFMPAKKWHSESHAKKTSAVHGPHGRVG